MAKFIELKDLSLFLAPPLIKQSKLILKI